MNSALLSSKKMDWCTPQDFFDHLNEEFGFVLDAAATDKTANARFTIRRKRTGFRKAGIAAARFSAIRLTDARSESG